LKCSHKFICGALGCGLDQVRQPVHERPHPQHATRNTQHAIKAFAQHIDTAIRGADFEFQMGVPRDEKTG
jgi:hypothetical protein